MAANGRQRLCLPPPRSKEERDSARRLYERGEGYREICEATGVPVSTIRVWKAREAWQKPGSQLAITSLTQQTWQSTLNAAPVLTGTAGGTYIEAGTALILVAGGTVNIAGTMNNTAATDRPA